MQLTYELYQHVLDSEIVNRRLSQKHFTEQELWYLLYNVLESCKSFEGAEGDARKIGDIRPKNILLNDAGKVKLVNRWSWPGEQSGLEKMLSGSGEKCYLGTWWIMKRRRNCCLFANRQSASTGWNRTRLTRSASA